MYSGNQMLVPLQCEPSLAFSTNTSLIVLIPIYPVGIYGAKLSWYMVFTLRDMVLFLLILMMRAY